MEAIERIEKVKANISSLKEVARAANVSVTTASRILHRKKLEEFSEETKQRVQETAKELQWRPNLLVHGMQTGRTRTIGVMVPPFNSHWSEILYGIHDGLIQDDYIPIILWGKHWREDEQHYAAENLGQIHRLIDRRVEGFILWPPMVKPYYDNIEETRNIPVVTIDHELPPECGADSVTTDEETVAKLVASHLLNLGHRHIAHFAGSGNKIYSWAKLRSEYFEKEVTSVPGATCQIVEQWQHDYDEGVSVAKKLLQMNPRPTAVFAASDQRAQYVYDAAAQLGLGIPQDLSVVGFADLTNAARLQPALTNVRQKSYETGNIAAKLILERLQKTHKEPHNHQRIRVGCELVIRNSTAVSGNGG
jgi:LacI family transcriptional regulator